MGKILTDRPLIVLSSPIKALAFFFTCISALFVAEWSIRLALPSYERSGDLVFEKDPGTRLVLGQSNTVVRQVKNSGDYDVAVRINRHGLRDRKDVAQGLRDDLYVVGDSFTFGWGVEETERFSDRLAKLTGRRVYNLSSPINIDSYENMLSYAASLGAEIKDVVIAINMIDDFVVIEPPAAAPKKVASAEGQKLDVAEVIHRIKNFLIHNSALYFALTSGVNTIDWLRAALVRIGLIVTLDKVWGAPGDDAINQSITALARIEEKYPVTIMLIPSRGLWVGDKKQELADYHERIRSELLRRGFRVVDMRPVFEAAGTPMAFHFQNDGHWNPRGHALAAETLYKVVR